MVVHPTVFKRLKRFYDPTIAVSKCRYCTLNNECMAFGCTRTSLSSATRRNSTSFRCTPGVHLCSAHGLRVNVNRKSCSTLQTLLLKDGRTIQNVWRTQSGDVARKHQMSLEDTDERFAKRRRSGLRLQKYVRNLRLEQVNAIDGINQILNYLSSTEDVTEHHS